MTDARLEMRRRAIVRTARARGLTATRGRPGIPGFEPDPAGRAVRVADGDAYNVLVVGTDGAVLVWSMSSYYSKRLSQFVKRWTRKRR